MIKSKCKTKPSFLQRNQNGIAKIGFAGLLAAALALQASNYHKQSIRDNINQDIKFDIYSGYSEKEAIEMIKQDYIKKYGQNEKSMKQFRDFVVYSFKETDKHKDPFKKLEENINETLKKMQEK